MITYTTSVLDAWFLVLHGVRVAFLWVYTIWRGIVCTKRAPMRMHVYYELDLGANTFAAQ